MKLFKYEGFKVTISPEALLLKPFKKIWERDKSKSKDRALSELAFIYFYCDPRSDYMYIIDDETRMDEIKKGEGLKEDWEPDTHLIKAMELYTQLTTTTSAGLLQDARASVEKIREELRNLSFEAVDPAKLPKALKDAADTLTRIPDLMESLQKAERTLNSDILENSRMRGQGSKTIYEDGWGEQ